MTALLSVWVILTLKNSGCDTCITFRGKQFHKEHQGRKLKSSIRVITSFTNRNKYDRFGKLMIIQRKYIEE